MAKRTIVGDLINCRGFVFGPVNEMGVVALFAKLSEEIGFIVEEVRAEFLRAHKLNGGDAVEIIRIAQYEYRVRPAEAKPKRRSLE